MKALLAAVLFVLLPVAVSAQIVANPTTLEFVASSDHAAVDAITGKPVVTSYEYRATSTTASATAVVVDLGKPTPVNGKITLPIPQIATHTKGAEYRATITAKGPDGTGVSTPTDPFGWTLGRAPAAPTAVVVKP